MKLTKAAILGFGLLCFGCSNTGAPSSQAQGNNVPVSSTGRAPGGGEVTVDNQDRKFVELLTKHDRIGIELAESARSQKDAQAIQPIADRIVQQNTAQLEDLERLEQKLTIHTSTDNDRARAEVANSVASDRQHADMSGQAFRNDSLRNGQNTDQQHNNASLTDIGTANTAGVDLGPTAVVSSGAGGDYAQRWMSTIVEHEQAMLSQAQQLAPSLKDPEVKQYADQVISQKQQILADLQQQGAKVSAEPEE